MAQERGRPGVSGQGWPACAWHSSLGSRHRPNQLRTTVKRERRRTRRTNVNLRWERRKRNIIEWQRTNRQCNAAGATPVPDARCSTYFAFVVAHVRYEDKLPKRLADNVDAARRWVRKLGRGEIPLQVQPATLREQGPGSELPSPAVLESWGGETLQRLGHRPRAAAPHGAWTQTGGRAPASNRTGRSRAPPPLAAASRQKTLGPGSCSGKI
jgi:hypothetical protein